ncbi:coiled-coil domain-containing protein 162 [Pleuronectes platessa]|uniref:coiled-coil domain-containing protein 162 n=1 Tax=Pleuronectes platessa TaxID=8262 RepID=UPI00232A202D|nr:coiled-coil domain-containing protein 162 [Pleuronectes platessa]
MKTPSTTTRERLMEAFVSIQLEKVGLRDEMLNSYLKRKRAEGGLTQTPEEAAKIKRSLIIEFLKRFSTRISQYCVRAQIVEYYYSLTSLLDDVPSVRRSHFTREQTSSTKATVDSGVDLPPDPSSTLLSADGKTLLNLWVIPHFSEVLHMFKTLEISACAAALHHTLLIVSALHDVVCYLVSFSRLGNTEDGWSRRKLQEAPGSRLVADWGGAEGIGAELQEIQRQVDCLSDPSSPRSVGRLLQLRRQVLLLQFDTAVRHLIREAFLSAGDMASYQSVSDNMMTALPPLSDGIQADVFSITLPVPRPLETRGCRAQRLFPWRSFIACHGWFPLRVWDVPPIEFCMQLCLSGLRDCSRLQTNGAVLGVSLLMEDVLSSGGDAEPVRLHGNTDDLLHDGKPNEDPLRVQRVLKGFLLLTKQLQVFKESWARRRLGAEIFSSPALYQQSVNLYRAEVFHPSMKALARQMGKERDYELLISGSRALLPPAGASETDVKTWQLHTLLEITECDMIRAVQRRLHRELTLVLSERTRQDTCLPTELWKKGSLKHSVSAERPQVVEAFVEQLMEGAEQLEGQLTLSQDHLRLCSTHLGSSLMERERRSFLLYSHFYEQILQQQTQLLHQKEQDLKNLKDSQTSNIYQEVSVSCRGMMLQISALQARVAHLQEDKSSLEERLGLKFKERYDPLVRHLFSTCLQLKVRLDERRWQVEQDVSVMVNRIRAEGVDRIIKLKKKCGCTTGNEGLALTQSKKEEVHELSLENSQLTALLCKVMVLSRWRQVVDQGKLHRRLLQTQQSEISSRTEALRVKMVAEEEVILLQEELDAARQMLTSCQAECSRTKRLLGRKTEELQEARHQSAREARSRQKLETHRVQRLEEMRADVEDRDGQLRDLSQQLDRGGRMSQIQRHRSAREIRQVKEQLHQERCIKQEAFQQVEKLKHQVKDVGEAFSRRTSTAGQSRTCFTLSVSRLSSRSPSAGLHRVSRQHSALQPGSFTNPAALQDSATRHQRADTAWSRSNTRTDRATADPSRLRVLTADMLLPEL